MGIFLYIGHWWRFTNPGITLLPWNSQNWWEHGLLSSMGISGSKNRGTVPYKAIFGCIFLYIGLIYGRYLHFRILKWPLIPRVSQAQLEIFPNEPIHWSFISKQNVIFRGKQLEFGRWFPDEAPGGTGQNSLSGAQVPGCWLKPAGEEDKNPNIQLLFGFFIAQWKIPCAPMFVFKIVFVGRFMSKKWSTLCPLSWSHTQHPFTSRIA